MPTKNTPMEPDGGQAGGAAAATEAPATIATSQPAQIVALGRGRVGKTTFLNAVVQRHRPSNPGLQVWNADGHNATHSLSNFHPDALVPRDHSLDDLKSWYERRMQEQAAEGFDALLDVGGNDPLIKQMAAEVRLVRTLERRGIRLVAAHVFGPEKADLDYLQQVMKEDLFMPEATLLIANEGLVQTTRSVESAFGEIVTHPIVVQAVRRGARLVQMPALPCMSAVADRGLSFADVIAGKQKPGFEPLSFFDLTRVEIWWEEEMPAFFATIPGTWLPSFGGSDA